MQWISVKDRLPISSYDSYMVFDGESISIALFSNLCVCIDKPSPFKAVKDKCPCNRWWNQCVKCQRLDRDYIPIKQCGNPKESTECTWKFIGHDKEGCCYSGYYYEIEVTHWMILPDVPKDN